MLPCALRAACSSASFAPSFAALLVVFGAAKAQKAHSFAVPWKIALHRSKCSWLCLERRKGSGHSKRGEGEAKEKQLHCAAKQFLFEMPSAVVADSESMIAALGHLHLLPIILLVLALAPRRHIKEAKDCSLEDIAFFRTEPGAASPHALHKKTLEIHTGKEHISLERNVLST